MTQSGKYESLVKGNVRLVISSYYNNVIICEAFILLTHMKGLSLDNFFIDVAHII